MNKQNNSNDNFNSQTSRKLILPKIKTSKVNLMKNFFKYSLISLIILLFFIIIISLKIYLLMKKQNNFIELDEEEIMNNNLTNFIFKVNDLKRVLFIKKYKVINLVDNIRTEEYLYKKTYYDIYVLSEENKKYSASISIGSECITTNNEECEPKKKVDLIDQDSSNLRNSINIEEISDLKDIQILLCLVNFTENNNITSILCPESLPISKKIEIILDFVKYLNLNDDKKEIIINKTVFKEIIDNNQYIKEKREIKCDNNSNSQCLKEINKTIDLQGNIMSYNETFYSNLTNDVYNSHIKKIKLKIIDKTKNIQFYSPENYKIILNKLLSKLKPYLKNDKKFSDIILKNNTKRSLNTKNQYIIEEEKLFSYKHNDGIQLNLYLENNGGYNTETMDVYSYLKIDDKVNELVNLKQFSNFNTILKKLSSLSKAVDSLSSKLYNNIKINLNNISQTITDDIISLKNDIIYKDLSDIFDSTQKLQKLPFNIIEEFELLENELNKILNNLEDVYFIKKIKIVNENIYDYIKNSHIIVNNIYIKLINLTNLLMSSKNEVSSITDYYLNNTSYSVNNIIKDCQNILLNYYKNEKDLIMQKIELLLEEFEVNLNISIEKELKIINGIDLNLKNKNIIIENATNEDYSKLFITINKSKNILIQILDKIKLKIRKEIDLKDSENFITNYEIKSNNESFNYIINKAINLNNKIENKEYLDKTFNEIMINFKKNFSSINNYINERIEEQFYLDENSLKDNYFTLNEQNNITNEFKKLVTSIVDKIEKENELYLMKVNETINLFIKDNKEYLNKLISEINIIFSDEILEEISISFENAFESTLNKIKEDLQYNELLSKNYFNELFDIVNNNKKALNILSTTCKQDIIFWQYLPICKNDNNYHCYYKSYCNDSIINITKTYSYINNYNSYLEHMNNSNIYISEILNKEIYNEYKNSINKIKNLFHSIKNNKLLILENNIFNNEISFIKKNMKKIDILNDKFNKYISDNVFNYKYQEKIDNFKLMKIDIIQNELKKFSIEKEISINDFCINYNREITYNFANGATAFRTIVNHFCYKALNSINNLKNISTYSNELKSHIEKFNDFYTLLSDKINSYNSKFDELKSNLFSIEQKVINKNLTFNYLFPIKQKISQILSQKYEDNIINASYSYYYNIIKQRLNNTINDINLKWNKLFIFLKKNIALNNNTFKYSYDEFGIISLIYENLITNIITEENFNSIELQQKIEFNYTISYYYNFLLNLVENIKYNILSRIPINLNGFNNLTEQRKKEINDEFNIIIDSLIKYKNENLNNQNQIDILKIEKMNFFDINSISSINTNELKNSLRETILNIYENQENKIDYKYSFISKLYLEYFDNKNQMDEYYRHLKNNFNLNLGNFLVIFEDNWIPYQYDIINKIKSLINDLNNELFKKITAIKNNYTDIFYEQINNQINIVEKINNLYKNEIKEIDNMEINSIKQYINEIIKKVKKHISDESVRLKNNANSYNNNFTKINNTIKEYKENIFNQINNSILYLVQEFNENIYNNIYKIFLQNNLNEYLIEVDNITSFLKEYKMLNSSYNIGEIINKIIKEIVKEYKILTKMQIDYKYKEYIDKFNNIFELKQIQKLINDEIDQEYNSSLFISLKKVAIYNYKEIGYEHYDFNSTIKKDIESTLNITINNIKNILNKNKGNNYQVNINNWENLNISYITETIMEINESFHQFIDSYKTFEIEIFNNNTKKIIELNFNNSIINLVNLFGNEFFERIIKHNENYKVKNFYNLLKYSLSQTLNYYETLLNNNNFDILPKDLILKINDLNSLNYLLDNYNENILKMFNEKIVDFIEESKEKIINQYFNYIKNNIIIEISFEKKIYLLIKQNLDNIKPNLENFYINLLNNILKDKSHNFYSNSLSQLKSEIINFEKEEKKKINIKIDNIYSIDNEYIHKEINFKINDISNSIKEYNTHFNNFKISDELILFLYNFGKSIIKPCYYPIINLLNNNTRDNITLELEYNIQNFKNSFIFSNFNHSLNNKYLSLKDYFENIKYNIYSYGISEYPENLEKEIYTIKNIDNGNTTGYNESQYTLVDNNFKNMLNESLKAIEFINTYNEYNNFEEELLNNILKFNMSYNTSEKTIIESYYLENINNTLNDKLLELKNIGLEYYNKVNDSFYLIKNYINESIYEIDSLLNQCENITYKTLYDMYEKISKEAELFDKEENEIYDETQTISHVSNYQDIYYITDIKIIELMKKARFIYDIKFENKIPQLKISLINQNIPKKILFSIYNSFGYCGKNVEDIEVKFNNINFTTNIESNIKSKKLNVKTITNFDSYHYIIEKYKIEDNNETKCSNIMYINLCYNVGKCSNNPVNRKKIVKKIAKKDNIKNYSIQITNI